MCAEGEDALAQRRRAAAKLLEACSERCIIRSRLKLAYPLEPLPGDMLADALRIGRQA